MKSKIFYTISIPIFEDNFATKDEEMIVKYLVQEIHGSRSLSPNVIEEVKYRTNLGSNDHSRDGIIAYLILKEILLTEHSLGQHYNNLKDTPYKSPQLYHTLQKNTRYFISERNEIDKCLTTKGGSIDINTELALQSLIDDIYSARDSSMIFGSPMFIGEEKEKETETETDFLEQVETKNILSLPPPIEPIPSLSTNPYTLAPLIEDELGFQDQMTASVLVDSYYEYYGHIYIGPGKTFGSLNGIGIRTSIKNLLCRSIKGISEKIFQGLLKWGLKYKFNHVRVLTPFDSVRPSLIKMGFVFDKIDEPVLYLTPAITNEDNIEIKIIEYGPYYIDLIEPLAKSEEFFQDAENLAKYNHMKLGDDILNHLKFNLLYFPGRLLNATKFENFNDD